VLEKFRKILLKSCAKRRRRKLVAFSPSSKQVLTLGRKQLEFQKNSSKNLLIREGNQLAFQKNSSKNLLIREGNQLAFQKNSSKNLFDTKKRRKIGRAIFLSRKQLLTLAVVIAEI
jgi:hypothetical protein